MRLLISMVAALMTLNLNTPAWTQEVTPQVLLQRALQVRGGNDKLVRSKADLTRMKGTLFLGGGKTATFTVDTTIQLPGMMKNIQRITLDGRTVTIVQVLNGERSWFTLNDQPQKLEKATLSELSETLYLNRVTRLFPLLTEGTFQLEYLGEAKINDRPAQLLKVVGKGHRDVRLFFDKETGFLVKTEHQLEDGSGKEMKEERFYSDFRSVGGIIRPIKVSAHRMGVKIMEAELLEVKYFDRIEDSEFAHP